jgi:pimeloyl-ACP methyl ester carboxylesterase
MVPVGHGQALVDAVPGASLEILEACGHCPQIERPDLLLPLLNSFLRPVTLRS